MMASRFLAQLMDLGITAKKWSQEGRLDFWGMLINAKSVSRVSVIVG